MCIRDRNNVIYNDENAKIIEDKLLEQATVGIDSKYKLSSDKKKGMISRKMCIRDRTMVY